MNFRCCIAWGSREKSHYIWDGEYQEIINEKCLNCTLLYPYQKNTYLHINTWICYTCMYSLSLGNLHQWFHWHTMWIYIIHKDNVHSKEKTSWETREVKTSWKWRRKNMLQRWGYINWRKNFLPWKSVSLKNPSPSTTKKGFLLLKIRKHVLHGDHFSIFLVSLWSKTIKWCWFL